MAITITLDTVRGSGASISSSGRRYFRGANVQGLVGSAAEKIAVAVHAIEDAGHIINISPHPVEVGCLLSGIDVDAVAADYVDLRLTYQTPNFIPAGSYRTTAYNKLSCRAYLKQVETSYNLDGTDIKVEWSPPFGHPLYNVYPNNTIPQYKSVIRDWPAATFSLPQQELYDPTEKVRAYLGKLNSGGFCLDQNALPETYKLADVQYETIDGINYDVVYIYEYFAKITANGITMGGWNDQTIMFIDPTTGHCPVKNSDTVKKVSQASTINFNLLNLVLDIA